MLRKNAGLLPSLAKIQAMRRILVKLLNIAEFLSPKVRRRINHDGNFQKFSEKFKCHFTETREDEKQMNFEKAFVAC